MSGRLVLAGFFLLPGACGDSPQAERAKDPMARTDDLWPGLERAAMRAPPSALEVETACNKAISHSIAETEKSGGIVDPTYYDYPVRNPVCAPEPGSASTILCRFELATIYEVLPSPEQRREALKRMRPGDWQPYRARLVSVGGSDYSEWIAPAGCEPVPKPAS
jgi:hypothetical protein